MASGMIKSHKTDGLYLLAFTLPSGTSALQIQSENFLSYIKVLLTIQNAELLLKKFHTFSKEMQNPKKFPFKLKFLFFASILNP